MIIITSIREKDLDAAKNLFLQSRLSTFTWSNASKFELSDFDIQTKDEVIYVALSDEQVIGFVSVWAIDNFVHHLYVDERFFNQKVGTLLLKTVIEKFGLPIRLKCDENNSKAISFYSKRGFLEIGRGESETGKYLLLELNKIIE
jgi:ribosomal protein S18 acetylase RimI-like enzyme